MVLLIILAFAGVLAWALTVVVRRYALSRSLLDIPGARSSHRQATPRGGGLAIVAAFMLGMVGLYFADSDVPSGLSWALYGAGIGVALLGFADDHGHVAARWRLLGHFMAAIWGLYWLDGLPPLTFGRNSLDLGFVGHVLAVFYLVWLLNLYNFMDGIDGLASVEAICVCVGGALALWIVNSEMPAPDVPGSSAAVQPMLLLAVAIGGFLIWNFPPARIFMGDAGSGFIGIVLGLLSLQAAWLHPALLWCWLILLGVFIVDATVTLLRRLLRGDRVYEAHRSHAYQYASRRHGSHLPVVLAVLAINLFWLLPIALCVAIGWLDGMVGVVVAYAPLVALAVRFRAGQPEIGA